MENTNIDVSIDINEKNIDIEDDIEKKSPKLFKHMVLSGGGPVGFIFIGIIQQLHMKKYWNMNELISIYGTSIGAIIGCIICIMGDDWDVINKYLIERPWHKLFEIKPSNLMNIFNNKGVYDGKLLMLEFFKPLLKSKHLELSITMKELYNFCNIDLHIFSCNINNNFDTIDISHDTYPDLEVITALSMTSSLPGIVQPIFYKDGCYVDGGATCPYPIYHCNKKYICDNSDITSDIYDNILGIRLKENDNNINYTCLESNTTLEYFMNLAHISLQYLRYNSDKINGFIENTENLIKYTIIVPNDIDAMSIKTMEEVSKSQELRKQLINRGINYDIKL